MNVKNLRVLKVLALALAAGAIVACNPGSKAGVDRNAALVNAKGSTTVNRYLWSASLETLDFLPVNRADPVAGLIITDWYSNPESPAEQFKVTVYILDSALRADALRVSVFRQQKDAAGAWAGFTPGTRNATTCPTA